MRWAPGARERLVEAAFELFVEHGYDSTTVPQITSRAGLTTRTFFRHFADKREVIFGGSEIPETAARLIRDAPAGTPEGVVVAVLHQIASDRFEGRRAQTAAWRRLIEDNDSLRDRDARKRSDLVRAVTNAFVDRGEPPLEANLHAEVGALVFHVALDRWIAKGEERALADIMDNVLGLVRAVPAASSRLREPVETVETEEFSRHDTQECERDGRGQGAESSADT